jgi:hypothetical protein
LNIFIPIKYSFGLVSHVFNTLSYKFNLLFEKREDTKLTINKNKISNKIIYSNVSIPYDDSIIKINSEIAVDSNNNVSCTNLQNDIFDELMEKYVKLIDDDDEINKININLIHSSDKIKVYIDAIDLIYIKNIEKCISYIATHSYTIIFDLCLKNMKKY